MDEWREEGMDGGKEGRRMDDCTRIYRYVCMYVCMVRGTEGRAQLVLVGNEERPGPYLCGA